MNIINLPFHERAKSITLFADLDHASCVVSVASEVNVLPI